MATQKFSDLTATTRGGGSTSSQTRGLLSGGRTPTQVNTIQYITNINQEKKEYIYSKFDITQSFLSPSIHPKNRAQFP